MLPKSLFLSLLVLVISSEAIREDWDILIFVQSWPGTNCLVYEKTTNKECKIQNKNDWNIHGIWPSKINGKYPENCPGKDLNLNELNKVYGMDLNDRWGDFKGNPKQFWKREWDKHGKCASSIFDDPKKYFKTALDWSRKYDMKQIFAKDNIVPGSKWYKVEDFIKSTIRHLGRKPTLMCSSVEKTLYLDDVRLCFDKSQTLIDCISKPSPITEPLNSKVIKFQCPENGYKVLYAGSSGISKHSNISNIFLFLSMFIFSVFHLL